ncbi:hypothetical protein HELRODRAFT_180190 [Helobdella robusta]|uniref:ILEI/PANDER domain-containing protein n=1 Tax=Helobdella robusta TaxID=6412 RepID=T1FFK3_HELRO|nr:hypothetical protein HELRODRAFT_180190 [Helobdella robusta]ESN94033.1 hypothetical protein HELRODRAFT_180190 [Helobdella robusta]
MNVIVKVAHLTTIHLLAASILKLVSSDKTFNKLAWKGFPLCSNSINNTLLSQKFNVTAEEFNSRRFVKTCGIHCQLMSPSCIAFQVNVLKSVNGGSYNLYCYGFDDLPSDICMNLNDNCSFFLADKPIYMTVSSWEYGNPLPQSTLVEVVGAGKYYTSITYPIGVSTYKLNMLARSLYDYHSFNTYNDPNMALYMKNYLMNTTNGTVIVGQTGDEPASAIQGVADYLKSVNLDVSTLQFRGKWVFVWQQGAYGKTKSHIFNGYGLFTKQFLICNLGLTCLHFFVRFQG